jgi:putative peptidoglycan lipid II flippase
VTAARHLARAGLIVAAAFFLSRVLGWVRLVVITNMFGAGAELDAYFAAFRLPDAIFELVAAGALSSAMIPVLAGLYQRDEEARAWRVVSTVLNAMLVALIVLAVIVGIFAPVIVPLIVPGFDAATTALTIDLTRIMLASPILLAMGAVASSVLNSRGRFAASALAPSLYNLAIIGGAILLGPALGVYGLAIGVVIGGLFHVLVQLPALFREGFRPSSRIDLSDIQSRQVLKLMAPRALGLGANQVTFIVATLLATGLGLGAVTSYSVAWTVMQIPLGILVFPLGVVLLPAMSRAVATEATREFGELVVRSVRLLLYMTLFVTAVGIVLREQTIALLFGRGLDAVAIRATSDTLGVLLLGLGGFSMVIVFARAFYSGQDTRTPVLTALLDMTVAIGVGVLTVGNLGLQGIALGLAAGGWTEATALGVLLWRRTPGAGVERIVRPLLLFAVGAALAGAAAYAIAQLTTPYFGTQPGALGLIAQISVAGGGALLVYALYTYLLRIPELTQALALVRQMFSRGGTSS